MANSKTPARPAPARRRQPEEYSRPNPIVGLIRSPIFIALFVILALTTGGVLSYYYFRYTRLIDAGLRGDIFVRSSGIYAAPTRIWAGSSAKQADVIAHLKHIGYQDQAGAADKRRGSFMSRGAVLEIHPGSDATVDRSRPFHDLKVSFAKNGDGIQAITDLSSRESVKDAVLEPELVSSVLNPEREKRKIIDYKDLPENLVQAIVAIEDRQFFE